MQRAVAGTIFEVEKDMMANENVAMDIANSIEEKESDLDRRARNFIEGILKKLFESEKTTSVTFCSKNGFFDGQLLHKAYYMANKYGLCSMMKLGEDAGYAYEFWYSNK